MVIRGLRFVFILIFLPNLTFCLKYQPRQFTNLYKKTQFTNFDRFRGRLSGYPAPPRGKWAYPSKIYSNIRQPNSLSNHIQPIRDSKYPYTHNFPSSRVEISPNEVVGSSTWNDALDWDYQLDPNVCHNLRGMSRMQVKLCHKYPDSVSAAVIGLKMAVKECQKQLKNHRWNCTSLTPYEDNPHLAPIMGKGYSETGFVHAITAAGVTHSVARACAAGKLTSCSCGMVKGKRAWKWSGCHDNTKYGARFSRMFLDVRERDRDVVSYTHLYNNELGRKIVRRNREVHCKCHGMSGSCEIRTCWKAVPKFRTVGKTLGKKFENVLSASHAVFGNAARRLGSVKQLRKDISLGSPLIYAEQSPSFCRADSQLGVAGTLGRECNRTSTGVDSCDSLCCGRGYNIVKRKTIRKCQCRFKWCCHVTCHDCVRHEWITMCK